MHGGKGANPVAGRSAAEKILVRQTAWCAGPAAVAMAEPGKVERQTRALHWDERGVGMVDGDDSGEDGGVSGGQYGCVDAMAMRTATWSAGTVAGNGA